MRKIVISFLFLLLVVFGFCYWSAPSNKPINNGLTLIEATAKIDSWDSTSMGDKYDDFIDIAKVAFVDEPLAEKIYLMTNTDECTLLMKTLIEYEKTKDKNILLGYLNSKDLDRVYITLYVINSLKYVEFLNDIKELDISFATDDNSGPLISDYSDRTFLEMSLKGTIATLEKELGLRAE